jgi:hypothetical protein
MVIWVPKWSKWKVFLCGREGAEGGEEAETVDEGY